MFVVLVSNLVIMRAAGYAVFAPKSAPALAGNCCHVLRSEAECTFYHVFHVEFCVDAKCYDSLDVHTWFAYVRLFRVFDQDSTDASQGH